MTTPTPRTDELKKALWQLMQAQESEKVYAWRDAIHCGIEQIERDLAAAQEARQAAEADKVTWRNAHSMEHLKRLDAEALAAQNAKDAERLQWLMDAPGKWWMEDGGFEAHMTGRLREAIDAAIAGEKK